MGFFSGMLGFADREFDHIVSEAATLASDVEKAFAPRTPPANSCEAQVQQVTAASKRAFTAMPTNSPVMSCQEDPAAGPTSAHTVVVPASGDSGMNIDAAVRHLDAAAHKMSTGWCARYVRQALAAGGITGVGPPEARLYGPFLLAAGFVVVPNTVPYVPKKGDVIVLQPYPNAPAEVQAGHIEMYDGKGWVSDFHQNGMWAGPGFRAYNQYHPDSYAIYRP